MSRVLWFTVYSDALYQEMVDIYRRRCTGIHIYGGIKQVYMVYNTVTYNTAVCFIIPAFHASLTGSIGLRGSGWWPRENDDRLTTIPATHSMNKKLERKNVSLTKNANNKKR